MESLKQIRKEKGFTLEQMSNQLGIGIQTYKNYEEGLHKVPKESALKICNILNLNVDDFFMPSHFTFCRK